MKRFFTAILLLLPISLFLVEPTFAANLASPNDPTQVGQQALATLQSLLGVFLNMMNLLIWPLLAMIGALMNNDLIFGPQVEDRLLLIWSQIRNLINLAAVLVLVGIALYNVAGIGEEGNYTIKKILPKFIIALLVVNFTFFGAKVVLSSVNVLTTAVYALPNSIEVNFSQIDTQGLASRNCPNIIRTYPQNSFCLDSNSFSPQAEQFFRNFTGDNIAYLMAMNLANISDIMKISDLVTEQPTLQNLSVNIIVSLALYIVYGASFVALFIVLVVRVVVLWFVIAFSPILAVQIIFPDGLKSLTGDFNIQDVFIKHAIAPAIIGFGMTIGYLMLDAYKQNSAPSASLQLGADFSNSFSSAGSGLQEILIGLAAAAIVWKVTFAAADGTLAKGITDQIKNGLESAGKFAFSLPKYMNVIPLPNNFNGNADGTESRTNLAQLGNTLDNARSKFVRDRGGSLLNGTPLPNNSTQMDQYIRNIGDRTGNAQADLMVMRALQDRNVQSIKVSQFRQMLTRIEADAASSQTQREGARELLRRIQNRNDNDTLQQVTADAALQNIYNRIVPLDTRVSSVEQLFATPAATTTTTTSTTTTPSGTPPADSTP